MSDLISQYEAVRNGGAGLIDLSSRGRITVGGTEAVMFLNGLITNDMKTLEEHHWMPAAFPNVQGRLIAAVRVIRLANETEKSPRFLLDTEAATHQAVLKTIERFTMAGDFRVTDITGTTATLSLQGRHGAEIARKVFGDSLAQLDRNGVAETNWNEANVTVVRSSHTGEDGFDIVVDSTLSDDLSQALIDAGAVFVHDDTLETLRIEAGIGHFGQDMDETNVITEVNLDDAISFTKGCYIGQEIIIRIKQRGHVAKKLTGLTFDDRENVDVGAIIKSGEGKDIGRITSTAYSPLLAKTIALGYVRYEHLASDTEVVVGENGIEAKVTDLPFVRGSWYEDEV